MSNQRTVTEEEYQEVLALRKEKEIDAVAEKIEKATKFISTYEKKIEAKKAERKALKEELKKLL